MSKPIRSEGKSQRWARAVLVLAFLAIISFPLLEIVSDGRKIGNLSQSLSRANELGMAFAEHSGALKSLDRWLAAVRYNVFGVTPNKSFYLGKNGWFVRREGKLREQDGDADITDAISDQLGQDSMSERELADTVRVLEERHRYLASHGIVYVLAIVPRKTSVYGEEIYGRRMLRRFGTTRLDQLAPRLEAHPFLNFVNLQKTLRERKSADPARDLLYLKTDGHWNMRGAYWGYRAIMDRLSELFPERRLRPMELSDFKVAIDEEWCHDGFGRSAGVCIREPYPVFIPLPGSPLYSVPVIGHAHAKSGTTLQPPASEWEHYADRSLLLTDGIGRTRVPSVFVQGAKGPAQRYRYIENYGEPEFDSIGMTTESFGSKMVYFFSAHARRLYRKREVGSLDPRHLVNLVEGSGGTLNVLIQVFPEGVISTAKPIKNLRYVREGARTAPETLHLASGGAAGRDLQDSEAEASNEEPA